MKRQINESPEEVAHVEQAEMKELETEAEDKRRRRINYHTMQILTVHGIFNCCRHRIGKDSHTSCWDCGAGMDDTEHVLY